MSSTEKILTEVLQRIDDSIRTPGRMWAEKNRLESETNDMADRNYQTGKEDIYAHARIMAGQAQKGFAPGVLAEILGLGREVAQFPFKWGSPNYTASEAWEEMKKDLKNNLLGYKIGRSNPNVPLDDIPELNNLKTLTRKDWEEKYQKLK